tara:strand:- start:853 stop:1398 length:546 start_codon:yes stop_codon:yes gene_type:complete
MSVSLQDQLRKSGLIDEKKAKQLKRAKSKQEKLARKTKNPAVDHHKLELERARSEQIAKDRQLNLEKNKQSEKHALAAQIKQLIEMNTVAKDGDQKFSFSDANVIKHIYISQTQIEQLSRGTLAIVMQKDGQQHTYVIVPASVATKIEQRDTKVVVFQAEQNTVDEDDPYADFQIPDDLTW